MNGRLFPASGTKALCRAMPKIRQTVRQDVPALLTMDAQRRF